MSDHTLEDPPIFEMHSSGDGEYHVRLISPWPVRTWITADIAEHESPIVVREGNLIRITVENAHAVYRITGAGPGPDCYAVEAVERSWQGRA